ncbi:SETMR methyltransferase, partial [Acromyrmex charruanus]
MEKNEFRAVIKYLHMKGLTPKEIKAELDDIHSTSAPAFATVYNWMNEFKRGRTSTCDAPRSGRPIKAATPEIIDKVDIVLIDRRVKVREFVEATGISHGTVISILHELGMKNRQDGCRVCSLWTISATISKQCLEMFQRNPDEFLRRFITVNETISPNEPSPKKAKIKFNEFRYELLPHPAYSPDLILCNYFLFPNLKKWFELIAETEAYFEGMDKSYYSNGLKKLENRWIKCTELKTDYVEK